MMYKQLFKRKALLLMVLCLGTMGYAQTLNTIAYASGCYDSNGSVSGGVSMTTVTVILQYTGAPAGDVIALNVTGAPTITIDPALEYCFSANSPSGPDRLQVIRYIPLPSGSSGTVNAQFVTNGTSAPTVNFTSVASNCVESSCQSGNTGGVVYHDYNVNGTKQSGEVKGVQNLTLYGYWQNGGSSGMATTTTDAFGRYEFITGSGANEIPSGSNVRLELGALPTGLYPTFANTDNGTDAAFFTAPACNVNFAVNYPGVYNQGINKVFLNLNTPRGGLTSNPNPKVDSTVVSIDYPLVNQYVGAPPIGYTPLNTPTTSVGATWGMAYHAPSKSLFEAAYMRRGVGFGTGGSGAIYRTINADNPATSSTSVYVDLNALGYDLGLDVHVLPDDFGTGAGSPCERTTRMSFGDMDISDDGRSLWVVNLNQRKLIRINITYPNGALKPGNLITAADITDWDIPNPCDVSKGDYRPFGLGINGNKVYVGLVCDASISQNRSDLTGTVYEFNPSGSTFTQVFQMALKHPRGYTLGEGVGQDVGWYPWFVDHFLIDYAFVPYVQSAYPVGYNGATISQPVLSDIDFEADGDMTLSFFDRMGSITTPINNYDCAIPVANLFRTGGDVLKVGLCEGTYKLEEDGVICNGDYNTYQSANPASSIQIGAIVQGPGGNEFYWDFQADLAEEGSEGAFATIEGLDSAIMTKMDPLAWFSHGVQMTNTKRGYLWAPGCCTAGGAGYGLEVVNNTTKTTNLGDIEFIRSTPPMEIGNRVWFDSDGDGVQDPAEAPVTGLEVRLYSCTGIMVGITTTDANGNFYFNTSNVDNAGVTAGGAPTSGSYTGLSTNACYNIVFGKDGSFNTGTQEFTLSGNPYNVTTTGVGEGVNGSSNNNDATIASGVHASVNGYPYIPVVTGENGSSNHRYDLGVRPPGVFPLNILSFSAKLIADDAFLNWTTTNEVNVSHFEISRSFDAQIFEQIGTVSAKGNTTTSTNYQLLDKKVGFSGSDKVYYRLVSKDIDGSTSSTNLVEINLEQENGRFVEAYPNPITENLFLNYQFDNNADVQVLDALGALVYTGELPASVAVQTLEIPTQNWASGIYYVKITSKNTVETLKVVK